MRSDNPAHPSAQHSSLPSLWLLLLLHHFPELSLSSVQQGGGGGKLCSSSSLTPLVFPAQSWNRAGAGSMWSHVDLPCPWVSEGASQGQAVPYLNEDVQKKAVLTSPIALQVTVSAAGHISSGTSPSLLAKSDWWEANGRRGAEQALHSHKNLQNFCSPKIWYYPDTWYCRFF